MEKNDRPRAASALVLVQKDDAAELDLLNLQRTELQREAKSQ
jgi:hypothetical protein